MEKKGQVIVIVEKEATGNKKEVMEVKFGEEERDGENIAVKSDSWLILGFWCCRRHWMCLRVWGLNDKRPYIPI